MKKNNVNFKLILFIFFIISIFNVSNSKNLDKFYKEDKISNYFSGILSFYDNDFNNSYKFLKPLKGVENAHSPYSQIYQRSLVNLERFDEAFKYSLSLENEKKNNFETNLIIGVYYLKNKNYDLAKKYFVKLKKDENATGFKDLLSRSINNWISFPSTNYSEAKKILDEMPIKFQEIKKIQNSFLECYYDTKFVEEGFENLIYDKNNNFSRYNYFYANYLLKKKERYRAIDTIDKALIKNPRNLNLNQLKVDLSSKKFKSQFDCNNLSDVIAEIFYIGSNILSSQSLYSLSNFYLNLAKYLNPLFISYETLYAENFYMINNLDKSKKIYKKIKNNGGAYSWDASKKISLILIEQDKKKESLKFLKQVFNNIKDPNIYEIYDYADFLKNNEKFEESIIYYTRLIKLIDKNHKLYPKVLESRGVSYERTAKWKKAEKDLLDSLEIAPNEAYVINYLAYSWIEKGINIDRSLKMLEKANNLKKNNGYITDSLGWALFKLKKYEKAKKYLEQAVKIMPSDPVINDHYADSLWMNQNEIQARYYWQYVLSLKEADQKLKKLIKIKLVSGLNSEI